MELGDIVFAINDVTWNGSPLRVMRGEIIEIRQRQDRGTSYYIKGILRGREHTIQTTELFRTPAEANARQDALITELVQSYESRLRGTNADTEPQEGPESEESFGLSAEALPQVPVILVGNEETESGA